MADLVIVDDQDPRIKYSGGWFRAGSTNEFDGTTTATQLPGTKATFTFTGNFVAVYGTITDESLKVPPVSTYSIDGSDIVVFAPTPGPAILYKQQFYKSPLLQDGDHSLVITSVVNNSRLWLDFIQYTPTSKAPPQPVTVIKTLISTSPGITSSDTSNTPAVTPPTTTADTTAQTKITDPFGGKQGNMTSSEGVSTVHKDTATETDTGLNNSPTLLANSADSPSGTSIPLLTSESKKVSTGAVVGGVIGGVAVFIIVFFLLWRWRRKEKPQLSQLETTSTRTHSSFWNHPPPSTTVAPFGMEQNSTFSQPIVVPAIPTHLQANQDSRSGGAGSPNHNSGYGYTTRGGVSSEKSGLHSSMVSDPYPHSRTSSTSQSQSQSLYGSSIGLMNAQRDPSEASSDSGRSAVPAPSRALHQHQYTQLVAGPSHVAAGSHLVAPLLQRHGDGSLYVQGMGDAPPAYQSAPSSSIPNRTIYNHPPTA